MAARALNALLRLFAGQDIEQRGKMKDWGAARPHTAHYTHIIHSAHKHTHTHTHTHTHPHTHTHTHRAHTLNTQHTHTHTQSTHTEHTHKLKNKNTFSVTNIHTHTQTYKQKHTHTTHTFAFLVTNMHTHTQTHTHTHTHTHTRTHRQGCRNDSSALSHLLSTEPRVAQAACQSTRRPHDSFSHSLSCRRGDEVTFCRLSSCHPSSSRQARRQGREGRKKRERD